MKTHPGWLALTSSAFARASISARSSGSICCPSAIRVSRMAASSTEAGMTLKGTPAACRRLFRVGLEEASMIVWAEMISVTSFLRRFGVLCESSFVVELQDRDRSFLDRSPGHIDDWPAIAGTQAPRVRQLLRDLLPVHIFVQVAVAHQPHAIAPDLGDAIDTSH